MSIPGFTAEMSVYISNRNYTMGNLNTAHNHSAIIPQQLNLQCAWLCAMCAAAIADGVPGDEVLFCTLCANECAGGIT